MEEKWSIEKLDGSNWNTWKFQMKHLLMAKGCFGWDDVGHIQRYCPRERKWHIAKIAESEKSRKEN